MDNLKSISCLTYEDTSHQSLLLAHMIVRTPLQIPERIQTPILIQFCWYRCIYRKPRGPPREQWRIGSLVRRVWLVLWLVSVVITNIKSISTINAQKNATYFTSCQQSSCFWKKAIQFTTEKEGRFKKKEY